MHEFHELLLFRFFKKFWDESDDECIPKYGDLIDVVIPTKGDKGGRRFGFARFDQVCVIQFEYELD